MHKFLFIAHKAWFYARTQVFWWVLAFFQLALIVCGAYYWKFVWSNPHYFAYWLLAFLFFIIICTVFWKLISNFDEKKNDFKIKPEIIVNCILIGLFIVLAILFSGKLFPLWPLRILATSVIIITFLAASLACVLLGLNYKKALNLSFDFWRKQSLVMTLLTLFLMIGHATFFGLGQVGSFELIETGVFSSQGFSVTIWSLLFIIIFFICLFFAWLNTLLVLGFLELIRTLKKPEALVTPQVEALPEVS